VNFSGTYRSGSPGRALVSDFSLASGGGGGGGTGGGTFVEDPPSNNVPGGTVSAPFTTFSGTIPPKPNATGWTLKPGSVTINIEGQTTGPTGAFDDDGGGNLSGTYSQVPGGPTFNGTGVIDYDTRAWNITLDQPFVEDAAITYDFVYQMFQSPGTNTTTTPSQPTAPTVGGPIFSLQVIQTGNQLTLVDNNGSRYTGMIVGVSTAGGDTSGENTGNVTATYEANGVVNGVEVSIVGTFSGIYTVEEDDEGAVVSGILENRLIEGTYIQPAGTGDLRGVGDTIEFSEAGTEEPNDLINDGT
jgi:hypothetical protein